MVIPKERKRRATLRIERNEYNRRQRQSRVMRSALPSPHWIDKHSDHQRRKREKKRCEVETLARVVAGLTI